jgi:phosphatidylserine/phosphatidylglycerophosphate/cardiolipin synthase-like enzyme
VTTNDPETGTHGIYFNRGVAASQAYSVKFAKFGTRTPKDMSDSEQTELKKWLSRGLHEALIAFITRGASPGLVIRAAVFEFTEPSVLAAFSEARSHGADVQIIYHDKDGTDEARDNNAAIAEAHLSRKMLIRRKHPQIAHNKFIVRGVRAANGSISGEQVWTGSTNLSRGGIFGHSNVGHVIRDASIARTYLDYWAQLADVARRQQVDDTKTVSAATRAFKSWVSAQNPFSGSDLAEAGIHVLFSPRTELDPLHWYAKGFATSPGSTYLTLPFGMDEAFETALAAAHQPGGPLRFVMLNKKDDHQEVWAADHCIQVAVGAKGGPDLLSRWAKETLTGFNRVYYLHTKILLLNALSATPTTISGSANFSEPSVMANDENVPIITGDLDVADVYFTEYTRIFQHFYARWWAQNLGPAGSDSHSYLSEDDSWQAPYWDPDSPKSRKRDLFANQVAGN